MSRADFVRAELLAYKCIAALNIGKLPLNPLEILSYCRNTVVHPYSEIRQRMGISRLAFRTDVMERRDGCTVVRILDDGRRIYEVLYNDEGNLFRERFTLAHELGHVILKHEHTGNLEEEQQANVFAGQLLCPRPLVHHLRKNGFHADGEMLRRIFCLSCSAGNVAARKMDLYGDIHEALVVKLLGDETINRAKVITGRDMAV